MIGQVIRRLLACVYGRESVFGEHALESVMSALREVTA